MIDKPEDVSRVGGIRNLGEDRKEMTTPDRSFTAFMNKVGEHSNMQSNAPEVSPFDLAQGKPPLATGPNLDSLLSQAKTAQMTLGDMSTKFSRKNLKIKTQQRGLLKNKLQNANVLMGQVNEKLNLPSVEDSPSTGGTILERFLNLVSKGQSNLVAAQKQLMSLKDKGESLSPVDLLFIQTKLAHAQQELEFSSIILSKALEDIKTIMNINL